jgi:thymidylate kinase
VKIIKNYKSTMEVWMMY